MPDFEDSNNNEMPNQICEKCPKYAKYEEYAKQDFFMPSTIEISQNCVFWHKVCQSGIPVKDNGNDK